MLVIDENSKSSWVIIMINPNQLIDSILIDPRAPKELADALIFYFKEKRGYKKAREIETL